MPILSAVMFSVLFLAILVLFALAVIVVPCVVILLVFRSKRQQQGFPVLPPDAGRSEPRTPPPAGRVD